MRAWFAALALFVSVAPAAFAGGIHARIEGPGADGLTYTVRAYSCDRNTKFEPWALAEGMVDGKHQTVLLRVKPTSEPGVFEFARAWKQEGRWMIRFMLGHPPAPATVATLRADGTVRDNKLYFKSDGSAECSRALNPNPAPGEDC